MDSFYQESWAFITQFYLFLKLKSIFKFINGRIQTEKLVYALLFWQYSILCNITESWLDSAAPRHHQIICTYVCKVTVTLLSYLHGVQTLVVKEIQSDIWWQEYFKGASLKYNERSIDKSTGRHWHACYLLEVFQVCDNIQCDIVGA